MSMMFQFARFSVICAHVMAYRFDLKRMSAIARLPSTQLKMIQNVPNLSKLAHHQTTPKKFIVVTGGVISGIGKGVTASSIGILLKMLRIRPTAIKIDPYLNVDAGTMSPFEHGEVFVLDDGAETDLDLGNYERFLDVILTSDSNLTTGKIYQSVVAKERRGDYLGKTVQIIPHITNEIIERILEVSRKPVDGSTYEPDVCVIELGGTIGDIESMPFVEALRQLQLQLPQENFCLVHVSMVPVVGESAEQKTKPTQHSVKELRALGLVPDFVVCRSPLELQIETRDKLSLFCNVPTTHVLSSPDIRNIYHVPLVMMQQNFHELISKRLNLMPASVPFTPVSVEVMHAPQTPALDHAFVSAWRDLVKKVDSAEDEAVIALVGKYTNLQDAYLSVINALRHSSIATNQKLRLEMIESSHLEQDTRMSDPVLYDDAWARLKAAHGILVPGGFGVRGVEGKVQAIKFARETKMPFLGVCLGMQVAVIEYCRHVLGRTGANSREFTPDICEEDAAVVFMPEGDKQQFGGTMRLGSRRTTLQPGSMVSKLYGDVDAVDERHRHRYEVNPDLVELLVSKGLRFTGKDEKKERMEVVELDASDHPYFVGVQFHPEFKSRPQRPAPVFLGLLTAVKQRKSNASS